MDDNPRDKQRRKPLQQHDGPPADAQARLQEAEALLAPRRVIVQDLPGERIHPNPFQVRQTFDDLEELAEAIKVQGFISRLRVRPHPDQPGFFQLVYGERRLRAARLAGLTAIPCEIAEHSDDELIEMALMENIHRRDLDPLEEAHGFQQLIDLRNYSIRRLAARIGKSPGYVQARLALLRLPADLQQMVDQRPDTMWAALPPMPDMTIIDLRDRTKTARARLEARLTKDLRSFRALAQRWRRLGADPDERVILLSFVEQLLSEVEALVEELGD